MDRHGGFQFSMVSSVHCCRLISGFVHSGCIMRPRKVMLPRSAVRSQALPTGGLNQDGMVKWMNLPLAKNGQTLECGLDIVHVDPV